MAKRKYQFKPDRFGAGVLNKLYIPKGGRLRILRWTLYALVFLAALVLQDSVLSRYRFFGGVIELAPAVLMLVTVAQGAQNGSVYALICSMIYVFAGTGPDYYCIFLLTLYACAGALLREEFLRRSGATIWLCAGLALTLYELSVFGVGLAFGLTDPGRITAFLMTAALSALVMPVLNALILRIGKIGGEQWKE